MRQDIIIQNGNNLGGYLNKIQSNFIEVYLKLQELQTKVDSQRLILSGTDDFPDMENIPEGTIYIKHE